MEQNPAWVAQDKRNSERICFANFAYGLRWTLYFKLVKEKQDSTLQAQTNKQQQLRRATDPKGSVSSARKGKNLRGCSG